jgi:uncharacterized YccA/Bax inhibitor family protein
LFGLVFAAAMYTWSLFDPSLGNVPALTWVGMIGGFILGLVTIFKPTSSPVTAPIYAVLQGMFLGGISAFFDSIYPGIAIQAVSLTLAVLGVKLFLYKARIIRVTEKLRSGIIAATGAIAMVYVVSWILGMFNIYLPMIHSSGIMGIGFSLFVVGLAAFNLLLDFDFIEKGARHGAPKYMEWFSAFGLMMTLVWLYLEILRLLSKLNRD